MLTFSVMVEINCRTKEEESMCVEEKEEVENETNVSAGVAGL